MNNANAQIDAFSQILNMKGLFMNKEEVENSPNARNSKNIMIDDFDQVSSNQKNNADQLYPSSPKSCPKK